MMKIDTTDVSATDVCEAVIIKQNSLINVILQVPGQIFTLAQMWHERATTRAGLRNLDARLLDDVGLNRRQADEEANKPFWI